MKLIKALAKFLCKVLIAVCTLINRALPLLILAGLWFLSGWMAAEADVTDTGVWGWLWTLEDEGTFATLREVTVLALVLVAFDFLHLREVSLPRLIFNRGKRVQAMEPIVRAATILGYFVLMAAVLRSVSMLLYT